MAIDTNSNYLISHRDYSKLLEENARLREALAFYARWDIYYQAVEQDAPEVLVDMGERARQARGEGDNTD